MDWLDCPELHGDAYDLFNTRESHQLISFQDNILSIIIYNEPLIVNKRIYNPDDKILSTIPKTDAEIQDRRKQQRDKLQEEDFFTKLSAETLADKQHFDECQKLYSQMVPVLRPHGPNGFEKEIPAKALAYQFMVNKDGYKKDFNVRPVRGILDKALTYNDANRILNTPNAHDDVIEQCMRFHRLNFPHRYGAKLKTPNFSTVLNDLNIDAGHHLAQIAYEQQIDCVFLLPMEHKPRYYEMGNLDDVRKVKWAHRDKIAVPATASRKVPDSYNIKRITDALFNKNPDTTLDGFSTCISQFRNQIPVAIQKGYINNPRAMAA